MMLITHVRGSRRWGVSALLLVALAAGAALLSIRPVAAYTARADLQVSAALASYTDTPTGPLQTFRVTVRNPREYDAELHREYGARASGVVTQFTAGGYYVVQSVTGTNGFACSFAGRVATCTSGVIDNGGSATITVVIKQQLPPSPWDYNTYCLPTHTAVVDPANTIVERDETNNSWSKAYFECFN